MSTGYPQRDPDENDGREYQQKILNNQNRILNNQHTIQSKVERATYRSGIQISFPIIGLVTMIAAIRGCYIASEINEKLDNRDQQKIERLEEIE